MTSRCDAFMDLPEYIRTFPGINFTLFSRHDLGTPACAVIISVLFSFWLSGKFTRTRQISVDQCSDLILSIPSTATSI